MIVVIDNKDSFVWNVVDYVSIFDKVEVLPNTASVSDIKKFDPDGIIISSGPGSPENKKYIGNCFDFLDLGIPLLGIGLGFQIISYFFGSKIVKVKPMHGKASLIYHDKKNIFEDVTNPLKVGRYNSLAIESVPNNFKLTAISDDGIIMGIRHKEKMIEGVNFHPESILTPKNEGLKIFSNFVKICHVR
ncbi:MAG: aminodeoxychorismate/anthranilate synthase component II [Archaeoglobaceae archaeon]|nr:aminodeoxychorismate/anthranilate synthase component II [Archaeoglobaceae archaeon]MCX8152674.1 aminodeoxychorismate/anthranilate synthase component II [Archaeoglobaceae archaeon]MDW8013675.1 aminodeoxychorismate/anthranilate synthase component II [Archaeoglobaceae archaeon]